MRCLIALLLLALVTLGAANGAPPAKTAGPGNPVVAEDSSASTPGKTAAGKPAGAGQDCAPGRGHAACQEYCKQHCKLPCEEHCGKDCPEECRQFCRENCKRGDCGDRDGLPWMRGMTPEQRRTEREKLRTMPDEKRESYIQEQTQAWLQTQTPEEQEKFGAEQAARKARFEAMSPEERAAMRAKRGARRAPGGSR